MLLLCKDLDPDHHSQTSPDPDPLNTYAHSKHWFSNSLENTLEYFCNILIPFCARK